MLRVTNDNYSLSRKIGSLNLYKEKENNFFLKVDSAAVKEDSLVEAKWSAGSYKLIMHMGDGKYKLQFYSSA